MDPNKPKRITNQSSARSIAPLDLRRSILEGALNGQQQAQQVNLNLRQQGTRLEESLDSAKIIAKDVNQTSSAVDKLVVEARSSKWNRVCSCLRLIAGCCCHRGSQEETDSGLEDELERRIKDGYKSLNSSDTEEEDQSNLVDLNHLQNAREHEESMWKRTLVPLTSTTGDYRNETDVWYRQIDASLSRLQSLAEEMGQSLDEQIRMAQMLTIYLNFGVDQVMISNQKMTEVEALI